MRGVASAPFSPQDQEWVSGLPNALLLPSFLRRELRAPSCRQLRRLGGFAGRFADSDGLAEMRGEPEQFVLGQVAEKAVRLAVRAVDLEFLNGHVVDE